MLRLILAVCLVQLVLSMCPPVCVEQSVAQIDIVKSNPAIMSEPEEKQEGPTCPPYCEGDVVGPCEPFCHGHVEDGGCPPFCDPEKYPDMVSHETDGSSSSSD